MHPIIKQFQDAIARINAAMPTADISKAATLREKRAAIDVLKRSWQTHDTFLKACEEQVAKYGDAAPADVRALLKARRRELDAQAEQLVDLVVANGGKPDPYAYDPSDEPATGPTAPGIRADLDDGSNNLDGQSLLDDDPAKAAKHPEDWYNLHRAKGGAMIDGVRHATKSAERRPRIL